MEREVSPTEQRLNSNETLSKPQNKKGSALRVFAIFFHPGTAVTAIGGAEKRFIKTLRFYCKENSLEITVLESTPSLLIGTEVTCKKYSLPSSFRGKGWISTYIEWFFWIAKASLKSFSLASRAKPNVILVPNNTLPNLVLGRATSFLLRSPLCVVTHHIDVTFSVNGSSKSHSLYSCYRSIKYGKLVSLTKTLATYTMLSLLKRTKGIITVSNFTAATLRKHGACKSKILVSGNAVDADLIENARSCDKKTYDGVFVGRIAKEKGVFDLVRIWKEVVKVRKDAKFLLIGNGLEFSSVKEEIATSGLENKVFLRGSCEDKELHNLLNSSRIYVFPSLFEGWGIAVAEALACGLPVVAYDIPALREVFGNCRSVFLVPVKNIESMTSTVLDVLDANETEQRELSHYSRIYSRQFSWEKIAEKDLELLRIFEKDD